MATSSKSIEHHHTLANLASSTPNPTMTSASPTSTSKSTPASASITSKPTKTSSATAISNTSARELPKSQRLLEVDRLRQEAEQAAADQLQRQAEAEERAKYFQLQSCSPQDYLVRTVYPSLQEALQIIDTIRPEDPIQYLGLLLQKESQDTKKRVEQLNSIHQVREQLRELYQKEYAVAGRV